MAFQCMRNCLAVLAMASWSIRNQGARTEPVLVAEATSLTFSRTLPDEDTPSLHLKDGTIQLDWNPIDAKDVVVSKTTATLQVVANPLLNKRTTPIARQLFHSLQNLPADLVRYVAWFPYPHLAVAELEPPSHNTTSWKFGHELQQIFGDVFQAVTGNNANDKANAKKTKQRRVVINFSTQPTWMFNTTDWSYTKQVNQADWNYPRGTWTNATTQLVAGYYGRLASWMIHGEFTDEFGYRHRGGPALGDQVTHWEIFNEPEAEHALTWQQYNVLYDAIVDAVQKVAGREIKFVGMALESHYNWDYWRGFLTPDNHNQHGRTAVAHGMASFHYYGKISSRTNISTFVEPFAQLPRFLKEVDRIIQLRDELSPTTQLAINEAGIIPPNDNDPHADELPPLYFQMAAAHDMVLVAAVSHKGIDLVGLSQFCGCPALPQWQILDRQYPGVSMTNWTTGQGNPRYWALRLLLENGWGPGDQIIPTSTLDDKEQGTEVFVQGRVTIQKKRLVLIVNKTLQRQSLQLHHLTGATVHMVDETTGDGPWKTHTATSDRLVLKRFAVALVEMSPSDVDTTTASE